jgi:hypothetical protein
MRKKPYRKIQAKRGCSANRACSDEFDLSALAVTRGLDLWVNPIRIEMDCRAKPHRPEDKGVCGSLCSLSPLAGRGGLSTGADSPFYEAQTRGEAPSPGICAKSAQIPTPPRKRREVSGPACGKRSGSLLLPAAIRSPRDQNL